jgi:hypothetical protein
MPRKVIPEIEHALYRQLTNGYALRLRRNLADASLVLAVARHELTNHPGYDASLLVLAKLERVRSGVQLAESALAQLRDALALVGESSETTSEAQSDSEKSTSRKPPHAGARSET